MEKKKEKEKNEEIIKEKKGRGLRGRKGDGRQKR
jgi:hypothetical protein